MIREILENIKAKKYLVIILIVGIVLMIIPDISKNNKSERERISAMGGKNEIVQLERMLKNIDCIKDCNVYVTYENDGENEYAYDIRSGNNMELELKVSDKEPVIKSTSLPKIRGVLAVVKGGGIDENEVAYMIKRATGVSMHRIHVKVIKGE